MRMPIIPDDDAALLDDLRARSPEAFANLFEMYADRMYRLAVGMLADELEAEDVVQEAFTRFFEKLDVFEGRSQIGTWLYRVTYNLSIDCLRKRKSSTTISVQEDTDPDDDFPIPEVFVDWRHVPEMVLSETEISDQLDQAIHNLPEILKAVFLLREVEGLSTQACAEVLEISPANVKVRLHRARLHLREALTTYFVELGQEKQVLL